MPGGRVLALGERCLVMGVLNVTPDSFADSASRLEPSAAADAAARMEAEGADLVDIGGEYTRPGADPVSAAEEIARLRPVLDRLKDLRIPISIDTYKADVAAVGLDAGAVIVNDVTALRGDDRLAGLVGSRRAGLVLMHSRGGSKAMYERAEYQDVVGEVSAELRMAVERAVGAGVEIERIIVDPGIGFAKRPEHSYGVLARLTEVAAALDRPLLVGPSRKSFMREAAGGRPAALRDWTTAAAVAAAVLNGAHIVRVHAVAEMVQVVRTAEAVRRAATTDDRD